MLLRLHPGRALGFVAFLGGLALAACSASNGGNNTFGGNGNGNGGSGATGNGGSGATGNGGSGAGGGGGSLFGDAGQTDGNSEAGTCGGEDHQAQLIPLDMYIMLDQSGSMIGTKWDTVTQALKTFFNDPANTGIGVAMQYFGLPCDAFSSDSCNPSDYQNPEVAFGALPGNAPALSQSIDMHTQNCINTYGGTLTPTYAGLAGAVAGATAYAQQNPSHTVIVVLATDGDPTECDTNIGNIAQIAATGYNATPSIRTFVIGMQGATLSNLDQWANAGGSKQSFDASDPTKFSQALAQIRGAALSCSYQIPTPTTGAFHKDQVNVKYTPGGSTSPTTIGKVANAAACTAAGGWYYDNDTNPTQIIMCPSTCTTLSSDTSGKVQIVLGCQTIPA
jgi:hypothetical protein